MTIKLDPIELGNRIRHLRESHNMCQSDLAAELDISRGYLGCLERGECIARLQVYADLCGIFTVSADYLLFGTHIENDVCRKNVREAIGILERVEKLMLDGKIGKSN